MEDKSPSKGKQMNTQAKQQIHEGAMPIVRKNTLLLQLDYMYIVCEVHFINYLK